MLASVFSIFMTNVEKKVVDSQREVVLSLLPDGWTFEQFLYEPPSGEGFHHATALEKCLSKNKNPITIFLDVDCIPTKDSSLLKISNEAQQGILTGAVQRANHLRNDSHLYVGPFCMAFLNSQYKKLGSPSFKETDRGDCGEELTYKWEENGQPISFMWPSHVYHPAWPLKDGVVFGYGTEYDGLFYHAFAIRQSFMQEQFIKKCDEVLASNYPKKVVPEVKKEEIKESKKETKKEEPIKVDEPKKAVSTSQEIKPRETKKEVTLIKEENKSKERVAI